MKVDLVLPPYLPGTFFAVFSGVDLKTQVNLRAKLPPNVRAIVHRAELFHETAASVSNGVRLRVREWDLNSPEFSTQATGASNFSVANAELTFTAVPVGADGNGITINFVDPAANDATLGVEWVEAENAVNVNLATNGSGAITSTAAQVKAAILASAEVSAKVTVAFTAGNNGTGVVAATVLPIITEGGSTQFEGEAVQDVVAQVDTADTVAAGGVQVLTVAATKALREGSAFELTTLVGATASANVGSIILSGIAF